MIRRLLIMLVAACSLLAFAGTAAAVPAGSLAPASVDYGQVAVGSSSPVQEFTFTYTGGFSSSIDVTNVGLTGTDASEFTIAADGCFQQVIFEADSCTINVSFEPSSAGIKSATLTVTTNQGTPTVAALTGEGVAPQPAASLTPATFDYGQVEVNFAANAQFTLSNTGDAGSLLTITEIQLTGVVDDQFQIIGNNCPGSLSVGAKCTITVQFAPVLAGVKSTLLAVSSNATGPPKSSALSGEGVAPPPPLSLAPASHDYGQITVDSDSKTWEFALTYSSEGSEPIVLNDIAIAGSDAGQFLIASQDCPSTLAAGDRCTIDVLFAPFSAGAKSASLKIVSDAPGSPTIATLTGEGIAPQPPLSLAPATPATPPASPPSQSQLPSLDNPVLPTTPPPNLPPLESSWPKESVIARAYKHDSLAIPYEVNGYAAIEIVIKRSNKVVWTYHTGVLEAGTYELRIAATVIQRLAAGNYTITLTATRGDEESTQTMRLKVKKKKHR